MTAIDFPASPTDGQTFSPGNGVIYQWKAALGAWVIAFAPAGMVSFKTGAVVGTTPALAQWTTFAVNWSATPAYNNGGGGWNGTLYTVPVAGLYLVLANLCLGWPSIGNLYNSQGESNILKNGASIARNSIGHAINGGPYYADYPNAYVGPLAVNDTIGLSGFFGNTNVVFYSGVTDNNMSLVRLGS
jgi:hypothetical protein